ncbi:MAG TPA: ABC transporter substrate-binding protein, partial [Firmicutes bacterium]|nr:ABC transporter substrate-binding protein [Bacillota bacterium]
MKSRVGLALLVLVLAFSSWVGLVSAQPIKIGVFEPMTGPSAAGGEMTVEGIELAWELKPEVLGREVQIIVVDNKSDKVEAANAVSRLIERDQVVAIIGSYGSS